MKLIDPKQIRFTSARVVFLEMKDRPEQIQDPWPGFSVRLLQKPIPVHLYRELYYGVGEKWQWLDRMIMPDEVLSGLINAENTDIYQASVIDEKAGFAEFVTGSEYVEIQYFGLFPSFIGRGLGKYFLNWVINHAWSYGKPLIRLNTCDLDHPNALSVYKKAGFEEIKSIREERRILIQ